LLKVADLIACSMQYQEITCVRILFQDRVFLSNHFKESEWKLSSDIFWGEKQAGSIEVFYKEK
jgi:hypothetical protein